MLTLLGDRFAPTAWTVGFFNLPLVEIAKGLSGWREELYGSVVRTAVRGSLPELLKYLEPLTLRVRPRELLVQTTNPAWTAYFDCFANGTDADPTLAILTERLGCRGVFAQSIPHTLDERSDGQYGAVQFRMYGPDQKAGKYVRAVAALNDGGRWVFYVSGAPQPFEQLQKYSERTVRRRFSSEMLREYCSALGIDVFDEHFYGVRAELVESPLTLSEDFGARGGLSEFTFDENRVRLGLEPGDDVNK